MTIQELIDLLSKLPAKSRRVVLRGYEDGYKDISDIIQIDLVLDVNKEWYYGPHAEVESNQEPDERAIAIR